MRVFVAGLLLLFVISVVPCFVIGLADAAEIQVFSPPYDFALLQPRSPPPPGGPSPYAVTGGTPTWNIASWDIPGGNLSPFLSSTAGINTVFTASASEATVKIAHLPDGTAIYQLSQNGAVLPCEENGQPRESDLFAAPNALGTKAPDAPGLLIPASQPLTLSGLARLISTVTVTFQYGTATPVTSCAVSQGSPLVSIILNNASANQTLFYQLALSNVCGPQPAARAGLCNDWGANPQSNFFFQTNPFGVDDALPAFGQPWLANNETRTISVDLLPRLVNFITLGPAGMDHNPADWAVGSYYNGQHIWGGLVMTTTWKDVSLVAVTK